VSIILSTIGKELVGRPSVLRYLSNKVAEDISEDSFDFVAGNVPSGMIPGWQIRNNLEKLTGKEIPFIYVRGQPKKGGQKERLTGITSPLIHDGDTAVLVEIEANKEIFVENVLSSVEGAKGLRQSGYVVENVATFVKPDQYVIDKLSEKGLQVSYQVTNSELKLLLEKGVESIPIQSDFLNHRLGKEEIVKKIIDSGALEIRNLAAGDKPFLYSSGLWGPGYLMIKSLVGQPRVLNELTAQLTLGLELNEIDFVIGNVTGGAIPGWQIRNNLEKLTGKEIPYVYAEGTRVLQDGHLIQGNIVGDKNNSLIHKGDRALVVEELVNTAGTTAGSVIHARNQRYKADQATTLFSYHNPIALERFELHHIQFSHLIDLPTLLDVVEKKEMFPQEVIMDYREFLKDSMAYQKKWGLKPLVKDGGTK
jgi:orotate phosphoribosyltransferase